MKNTLIILSALLFFGCNHRTTYTPTKIPKPPKYHTLKTTSFILNECEYVKTNTIIGVMWIHDEKTCKNAIHKETNTKF